MSARCVILGHKWVRVRIDFPDHRVRYVYKCKYCQAERVEMVEEH